VLDRDSRNLIVAASPKSSAVIHPYLVGDDILGGGGIRRYLIDFKESSVLQAQAYKCAFEHLKTNVMPAMQDASKGESERSASIDSWWQHWRPRKELLQKIGSLTRYLACSRVTKRPIFVFIDSAIRPGDALQVFAFEDDYSFGILQSSAHWQWFVAKCSKLTERLRYTPESVFDTFPWPQSPTVAQVDAIAKAGKELRKLRETSLASMTGGLRALYRTLDLPGKNPLRDAHIALDAAVLKAYDFSANKDLLEQILELNHVVANKIAAAESVTPPGIPAIYKNSKNLISTDCLSE